LATGTACGKARSWRLSVVTQRHYDPTSTEPQYYECAICRDAPTFKFFNLLEDDDPCMFCSMRRIEALAAIVPMIDENGNLSDDVKTWWRDFCQTNQ
jgi:hypothetical protein